MTTRGRKKSSQQRLTRRAGGRAAGKKRPSHDRPAVVVLLSGGIDSASVLAAYIAARHPARAIFVDYGQPARRSELAAARALARLHSIRLDVVKLGVQLTSDNGQFFARNALLVLLAAAAESSRPLIVGLGIHSASPYYDTTSVFRADIQRVLDGYAAGTITLGAPFLEMTKGSVVKFARRHKVPLGLTYSCETKNAPACGECPSCRDRRACRVD